MFKNYMLVALRNFWHNKIFTAINILGLAIGISASCVIFLIVKYEYNFDRFEKNGSRIYRIVSEFAFQHGSTSHTRGVTAALSDAVKKELSGIDNTVSFRYYNVGTLAVPGSNPDKPSVFRAQEHVIFADNSYFILLPYKWLAGSSQSALNSAGRVVLTEKRAKLYFPSISYADLIGRKIIYDDSITALVSGVVEDLNKQGHTDFNFEEFISLPTVLNNDGLRKKFQWDQWGSTTSDQQLYVQLESATTSSSVEDKLKMIFDKYEGQDAKKNDFTWTFLLQPLNDIHFNQNYGDFDIHMANKATLEGLLLVAAFILFLGCINFINLSTAQASQRAKEIGIRKTLGSSKNQLKLQFLSETFLITLFATALSIALIPLLLKVFADFIPEGLHFSMAQPYTIAFLIALVLVVSILAGFYPALVLSSWNPLTVLKNQSHAGTGKTRRVWIRQSLTITQFFIAQFFIMGTFLVTKQIRFMLDKDLGFSKEAILSFSTPYSDTSVSRRYYLINELKNIPGIKLASLGNDVPSSYGWWTSDIEYKNGKKDLKEDVELKAGDTNYLKLFHIPIIAGRGLMPSDTIKEVIINENYLLLLGFVHPEDALGKNLFWNDKNTPIVGVMKDFNAHPLKFKIAPMVFCQSVENCRQIIISLRPRINPNTLSGASAGMNENDWKESIAKMGKIYSQVYPGEEFNYGFFDESIAKAYVGEQNISNLLKWATGLTVFISCLGLLGLVIYTTNLRIKEIGVRKVLGASVVHIVSIISKDFIKLVAIAFIIATPLAWWAMQKWLQDFTYRTELSWWIFAISGFGMIVIALITLSVQTIRAAMANPVNSLRSE